jgi:hypothetical protein
MMSSNVSLAIRIIAASVPAITIVLGALMIVAGVFLDQPILIISGFVFFVAGVLMQVGYLWTRIRRRRG